MKENSGVKAEEISEIARREMAEDEREKLFSKKAYYLIREAVQAQAEVDSEAFSEELENLKVFLKIFLFCFPWLEFYWRRLHEVQLSFEGNQRDLTSYFRVVTGVLGVLEEF